MKHFPIYLKVTDKRICIIGNEDDAVAKARLVAKSEALVEIYASAPEEGLSALIKNMTDKGTGQAIKHYPRAFDASDRDDEARPPIAFVYLTGPDASLMALFTAAHIPFCVIDNLAASTFTTPAIIDRAPLSIAIGTEGQAPVLARLLKKEFEERLPQSYGVLARVAGALREKVGAQLLAPQARDFWARYFEGAHSQMDGAGAHAHGEYLLAEMGGAPQAQPPVWFVGAGPGSPDLLTMQARRLLHEADIILHDRLVPPAILELCRREAEVIEVGKKGFEASWRQADINALMVAKAQTGQKLVRLKSGDATIFGRLDEEITALDGYNIPFEIAAGLTSASAGAAQMGASLTKRGRNSGFRILTGHDVNGYADHDWREMAKGLREDDFTAAVYMSVRAASYLSGRLIMHGAPPQIKVTIAENISRKDEGWLVTSLGDLPRAIAQADITGPALIYLGLAPHQAHLANLRPLAWKEALPHVTEQA